MNSLMDFAKVVGVVLGLLAPAGAAINYYAEHEFITIQSFEDANQKAEVRDLKRLIRSLEYKMQTGTITDQERWELQGYINELEELQG